MKLRDRATVLLVAVVAAAGCSWPGSSSSDSADYVVDDCERADLGVDSVARVWDDVLLDSIRRDTPAPTVHARNLFHTSAAMWDAWAAYDPSADGYFVHEKAEADDVEAAREAAISYAASRVLLWRYSHANGLAATFDELANTMQSLCYSVDYVDTEGDSPAALGNRIAAAVIDLRGGRRLARGAAIRRHVVQAGQRAARRRSAGIDDPIRTAGSRCRSVLRHAKRHPASGHAADIHFAALGPGVRVPRSTPAVDPGMPPQLGGEGDAYKDQALETFA